MASRTRRGTADPGRRPVSRRRGAPPTRHPVGAYLARLAPGSRRTMRQALEVIAGILSRGRQTASSLDWAALRYEETAAAREALAERYRPATANKMLSALRGVLKEAWRLRLMRAEVYHRAADLPAVRGQTLLRGRALTHDEVRRLFAKCREDRSNAGARDAALLATLYGAGLRRSEVVALDLFDLDQATGELRIRAGKGHKDRTSYVPDGSLRALRGWLRIRGRHPGPLFLPVNKAGRVGTRRMTDQAVLGILAKRALLAGVGRFSPHDLRRTYISDLFDAGADIATVQKLAGHANVTTTARYDRRPEETKRRAARLLEVPYEE